MVTNGVDVNDVAQVLGDTDVESVTCGLRPNESRELAAENVDLGTGEVLITHTKGRKDRSVPISEKTAEHIRLHIAQFHEETKSDPDAPLFYSVIHGIRNPLSLRRIRDIVRMYGESARKKCAEIPENVHPHMFGRHSRAMHLYQHGMPLELISQWLGHVNLETTLMYAHADTEHKRRALPRNAIC